MDAWEEKAKATGRENKSILSGLTAFHCESLKIRGVSRGEGKYGRKETGRSRGREAGWNVLYEGRIYFQLKK